jgi:hypothetical protein
MYIVSNVLVTGFYTYPEYTPMSEELLQPRFTRTRDRLSHRVAVLVGQFGEQPRHVALQRFPAFRAPKADLESPEKFL